MYIAHLMNFAWHFNEDFKLNTYSYARKGRFNEKLCWSREVMETYNTDHWMHVWHPSLQIFGNWIKYDTDFRGIYFKNPLWSSPSMDEVMSFSTNRVLQLFPEIQHIHRGQIEAHSFFIILVDTCADKYRLQKFRYSKIFWSFNIISDAYSC
jgi:hypothetical protein